MARLAAFALCVFLAACERAPVVEAGGERLTGSYVDGGEVAAFLGVPFAEPPLGELRWRAPQPRETTVAERSATEFGPACMQSMRILDWYRSMAVRFGGSEDDYDDLEVSEDCLYLNIWTPSIEPDASLPVVVWIHGGSNRSGWSYERNYHGDELAKEDVVVVSVAYRQGVFGFFSHPELAAEDAQANFAYWDLIAALRWIRENIASFGGDPGRVTLFGESAGAQNVVALMVVDEARGLFQRGIGQSTAGFGLERSSTLAREQRRALELAAALDIEPEGSLAALREVPAAELLAVYEERFSDYYHAAAVDGQLLKKPVWEYFQAQEFHVRELIIGSNKDEWYASIAEDANADDVEQEAAERFGEAGAEAARAILEEESDPRRAMDRVTTASGMLCPSLKLAAMMTDAGAAAWAYYFTRVREDAAAAELGAYHGAEYPYVFATHDEYMTTNDIDRALQHAMQSYWLNFASDGNPNGKGLPDWPRFTADDPLVQELGDAVQTIAPPEPVLCALFDEQLANRDQD